MTWPTVGAIFLGWLLGLLAPVIVDSIRRGYRIREIRKAVQTEIRELGLVLIDNAYLCEMGFGGFDRDFLRWYISAPDRLGAPSHSAQHLTHLKQLIDLDDTTFEKLVISTKTKPGLGQHLKKFGLPYLDSHIGDLGIFSEKKRLQILKIRADLERLNEEIDNARAYHMMTFQYGPSEPNGEIVRLNVKNCYASVGRFAKNLSENMIAFLSS